MLPAQLILCFVFFLESLSNSVFEDPKQGEETPSEAISGTDSVSLSQPRQTEDLSLSQTEENVTKEPKNIVMEVSCVEAAGDLTSGALSSQSEQSSAAVPMEVDQSAPSSGFTSAEQTPDSSQASLVIGASGSEGLETNQSIENLDKEETEKSVQVVKVKEEVKISEENKPVLKTDSAENLVTVEPCKKEEVLEETSMQVDNLASLETVLYAESPLNEKTEKSQNPELDKTSAEEKTQEEDKPSTDIEDAEMATEKKICSDEKSEIVSKPEKMETDEVSVGATENVEMDEAPKVVSPPSSSDPVMPTADTSVVSAQGGTTEETKQAPLTAEQQAKKKELMDRCIHALEYCLRRFPQHHKSRYRLAYVYFYSPEHKVTRPYLCHA